MMPNEEMLEEILSYHYKDGEDLNQEKLVEILREIQEVYGCINSEIQDKTAKFLNVRITLIENLINLYPSLKEKETRHTITVCMGRQCQINGSIKVMAAAEKAAGAGKGEISEDGRFRLTQRSCLKHCRTAPNMMVDNDLYTFVKPEDVAAILERYR